MPKHTNSLAEATSPYLLQHAHNPVDWVEWSEEAFQRAEKEGKLVLVSIGYSACHWCHVMEHESFEDENVAELMNKHFVCIKVDREERPDVDQVYMNAVQLMTQQGGWPLNCFTLPDGRPIYGGTYFPKDQWTQVLSNLWNTFVQEPEKVEQYASKLKEGIQLSEMIEVQTTREAFDPLVVEQLVQKWKRNFDFDNGGENRAPKFPLPNNYEFLLHYGFINNDNTVVNHVHRTLKKMARGGIYDQIGGGFSRYAVDMIWKVPHFEKMLYDNGQLLSVYAKAQQHTPGPEYEKVLKQTFDWLEREMLDQKNGGYFSALDADSEGVEGKYYTWTKEEIKDILGKDFEIAQSYYNINEKGYWENDVHIPLREKSDVEIAKSFNLSVDALREKIVEIDRKLLSVRSKRIAPGLDTKKITSWNALLIKGLIDAGSVLNDDKMKQAALKTADWIMSDMWDEERKKLYRVPFSEKSNIKGFLDDYANTIDAFIELYEKTFDEKWLRFAMEIMNSAINLFSDEKTKFFYYTENNTELIARKMEINDNVIPASNSVMGKNLYRLGILFYKNEFTQRAKQMLSNLYDQIPQYGSGYSNWAQLALYFNGPYRELAITGENALMELRKLNQEYLPHVLLAGGNAEDIPFLEGRVKPETTFYVCENQNCKAPKKTVEEALELIKK